MAIEYEKNDQFKALIGIAEDYTEWFSRIALLVAYHEEETVPDSLPVPDSFTQWVADKGGGVRVELKTLTSILEIEKTLGALGEEILEDLRSSIKPDRKVFTKFKNLQSAFLTSIRRLERDSGLEIDGVDDLTGMRPAHALRKDLDKEMSRLERNASSFTLVLLRIDGFNQFHDTSSVLEIVTQNIKQYLRPFDDAYYLDSGFFLLSLKHADIPGGEVVTLRIQNSLENDENNSHNITVSGALSEPVQGDEIFKLIDEMKTDLGKNADVANTILKFLDISPLEKFVISKS